MDEKYYQDLPIITAADVRLAESVLQMQPGLPAHDAERRPDVPRKPVQLPHQRRPDLGHRELLRRRRVRLRLGAPAEPGERSPRRSHQGGHGHHDDLLGPVRPHERRLHRVHLQVGHQQVPRQRLRATWPTTRSTPRASSRRPRPRCDNKNWGSTLGGPIIKNKTFFFVNVDWTQFRSGTLQGFGNTTPIDAFKNGDFSALLTGKQIGTDALGRPIFQGQIFNPATTRLVNGVPVRDPYPGNIIPANDPLRSMVAAQYASLMVQPDRPGLSNNVAGNPAGDQTWELDARNYPRPPRPQLLAELQGDVQRLLQQPPVGPQLRRGPGLHRPERPPDRFS